MDTYGGAPSRPGNGLARAHRTHASDAEHPPSPSYPLSPFLQEKLQRSRRVESERMSTQSSSDMLASSTSSRGMRSPSPADSQRPMSSAGGPEPAKPKKGLGVKEMEQTLSTLHKQNFDLKLELYHRRERQTALEERLDALEREAKERDELNDSLVRELEKRDKAVEDAVGMILALEKRVEQLLLERKMVRHVEAEGVAYARIDSPAAGSASRETAASAHSPLSDTKSPIRMPSFVSERSDNGGNLKDWYLGMGDSHLSLPRLVDGSPDTTRMDPRLASPALSDLSESSFVSIYGRGRTAELSSPPGNSPWPWDAATKKTPLPPLESPTRVRSSTPRQHRPSSSRATSGQFHNIGDVLGMGSSPLGRLEKLDVTRAASRNTPRPATAMRDKEQSPFARPSTSQGQPKSKKEKREALEKVLTQGHFSNPQALPPTPDTLSTTTLTHNDTPTRDEGPLTTLLRDHGHDGRGLPTSSATPLTTLDSRPQANATNGRLQPMHGDHETGSVAQTTNTRAPDGNRRGSDYPGFRPHTRVDSTTSSVDTWLRESLKPESMDALDPMSSVSQTRPSIDNGRVSPDLFSFPNSTAGWAAHAMFGTLRGTGYVGAAGKNTSATPIADMLDAIGASVPTPPILGEGRFTPTLAAGPTAPPPPNRRSSLHARTGTTADAMTGTEGVVQSTPRAVAASSGFTRSTSRGTRARSNSTSADARPPPARQLTELGLKQDRAMTVPPKQALAPPPSPPKQQQQQQQQQQQDHNPSKRYPPTASHHATTAPSSAPRPRSRGLNNFFRRSSLTNSSADPAQPQAPAPAASAPPTDSPFRPPPPQQQQQLSAVTSSSSSSGPMMGIPSWVRRGSVVEDERGCGATPPPILRNKAVSSSSSSSARRESQTPAQGGVEIEEDGGVALEGADGSGAAGWGGGGGASLGAPPGSSSSARSSRKSWGGGSLDGPVDGGGGSVPVGNGSAGNAAAGGGKRKWLGLGRVGSLRNRAA